MAYAYLYSDIDSWIFTSTCICIYTPQKDLEAQDGSQSYPNITPERHEVLASHWGCDELALAGNRKRKPGYQA